MSYFVFVAVKKAHSGFWDSKCFNDRTSATLENSHWYLLPLIRNFGRKSDGLYHRYRKRPTATLHIGCDFRVWLSSLKCLYLI